MQMGQSEGAHTQLEFGVRVAQRRGECNQKKIKKKKTSDATLEQQSASAFVGGACGVSGSQYQEGGLLRFLEF